MAKVSSPALRRANSAALSAIVIAFSLSMTEAHAQNFQVYDDEIDRTIEEIVVTGSRIKRRDLSSPSPLATIDMDTISFSGQPTLEETLNQMPQVIPDFSRNAYFGSDGTSTINLRGMGAGRTLVLLNARRLGPSGVGSAIDVNNLPQALIERVEIVTGGATTVYGSDAVAGVVNFITRDDFTGLSLEASANMTEKSDSEIYDMNLAFGHELASGRGNFTIYAGIYERKELLGSERPLGSVFLRNNNRTGELVVGGSGVVPAGHIFFPRVDFGNGPGQTTFNANGTPREYVNPDDLYNFAPSSQIQMPLSRYSAGVMATFDLNSGYELYLESSFANNQSTWQRPSVPAVEFILVNTDNPVLTPETRQLFIDNFETAPGSGLAAMSMGRRLLEIGPRIIDRDRDYWRTVAGMRGEFGNGWEIDGWITYTKSREKEFFVNDASASRFAQGLLVDPISGECFDPSNGCVPIDIFGEGRISEEAANFVRVTGVQNNTERTQTLASVVVTGTPLNTWEGPLDVAFGLEWRSDDVNFVADEILFSGDTLGFSGDAAVIGTESVTEIYAEAVIPLAQDKAWADYLGLEVGGRYSVYDHAGGVTTYKLGGEWQPFSSLRFRGMHQRSVRAPNNQELFQENFTETSVLVNPDGSGDPCSADNDPVGNGNSEKCIIQGLDPSQIGIFQASPVPVDFIGGGNPNLLPEEAKTYTVGLVITPDALPSWTFAIDYFKLELTDSIETIDARNICFDPLNTDNLFCENIRRDSNPLGADGNIVEVLETQGNLGLISTEGIDTQINYGADLPEGLSIFDGGSQLVVNLAWTSTLKYESQLASYGTTEDCAGFFGQFCNINVGDSISRVFPKNRVTTNINYASGPLSVHLTSRWIDGTKNSFRMLAAFLGQPEPLLAIESIGSKHYLDLGIGYELTEDLSIRFGANNLTGTNPPNMANQGAANNTEPGLFDMYGRSYYFSVRANFFQ